MSRYIRHLGILLSILLSTGIANAQNEEVTVTGIVKEKASQQPIQFATVMIGNKETGEAITGTTTGEDGKFSIKTTASDFFVEVTFIGYESQAKRDITIRDGKVDVGVIQLAEDSRSLKEVVVRGEKSRTEFQLDKRVFNVGQDLASTGAGALEVLNNVPSVNVTIEGQITLRGSAGVQILIDGKPSVMADQQSNALGTITADMIESIEVITNPSAKYAAEGTSGILNIILKKEEKKGLNGSVTLNTGVPQNHSVGVSLNRRTEKFNLFTQLGVGHRSLPQYSESINQDRINNTTVRSDGTEYRNETFYNVILGTDYHINPLNVITLSGNFAYEVEKQPSRYDFSFSDSTGAIVSRWNRQETTQATNPKYQYELQYEKKFEDNEDHVLLFSAIGSFFGKDQSSEFINTPVFGENFNNDQQTNTKFQQADYTFKLDYTNPLTEKVTIETGAQYLINDVGNDFAVRERIDGTLVTIDRLTNNFEYNQKVLGVYGTGSYEGKKWGVKAGLRVENTDLNTLLTTTNEANNRNFTNLFPTLHSSYKLTEKVSVQAGYSKRIYRPRLWDLNPFFNIRNNFNIRVGNPDLLPEFTDSFELTSIFNLKTASLNATVYHRATSDVVERVSTFENNVNTTRPMNIGTNKTTGFELNGDYSPNKWLKITGDLNINYFVREGEFQQQSFDFSGDQWSSQLTSKIGLPANFDLEISGNYQSSYRTVQSRVTGYAFADLGIRKKLKGGKAVINLGVRDIFASRIQESVIERSNFYLYDFGQRGRFVTLGFSYGFGKGEAMTYSGSRRR
ncbi:outer membrane beta-barrel family protein [Persicitalea jodogahamensis]|uniref:TonB-dependent receptor n=1 Tax=Persicitalea jodogahamensis TaxID=402147 RepID=A0A8J3D9S1_9BACT|nr:outer membrane beta-barrel family protein [Persicitalea jodogahamensis]GHB72946.1 TonB-dependent receptor [Persicitalea jodogahamensis]